MGNSLKSGINYDDLIKDKLNFILSFLLDQVLPCVSWLNHSRKGMPHFCALWRGVSIYSPVPLLDVCPRLIEGTVFASIHGLL